MAEKPILFNTKMVQAILEGEKTQTRQVMKPQPMGYEPALNTDGIWEFCDDVDPDPLHFHKCPYGQPGDSLWVRETWATINCYDHLKPSDIPKGDRRWPAVWYYAPTIAAASAQNTNNEFLGKTRPSIFMPRWASRITLHVTDVRVERVQDISEDDAEAEGVNKDYGNGWVSAHSHRHLFSQLWDSINAKRGYSWVVNSWVWVVEFEVRL